MHTVLINNIFLESKTLYVNSKALLLNTTVVHLNNVITCLQENNKSQGQSEVIIRKRTENAMSKRKRTKWSTEYNTREKS